MPKDHFDAVHDAVKNLFFTLLWLPYSDSDRIWDTRRPRHCLSTWTYLGPDSTSPSLGVKIAINQGALRCGVTFVLGEALPAEEEEAEAEALKEEEEEEEEIGRAHV